MSELQEEFRKSFKQELNDLLGKYDAKIVINDDKARFIAEHNIVIEFEYHQTLECVDDIIYGYEVESEMMNKGVE